jgi:hypothetical protein
VRSASNLQLNKVGSSTAILDVSKVDGVTPLITAGKILKTQCKQLLTLFLVMLGHEDVVELLLEEAHEKSCK